MCSLKSPNLRVVFMFAPLASLTSSPFLAAQWPVALGSVGSHPFRSLPSKSDSGDFQAAGALRFNSGARTPARLTELPPRFWVPVSLAPEASSCQLKLGPRLRVSLLPSSL